jgi:hypothetical protein
LAGGLQPPGLPGSPVPIAVAYVRSSSRPTEADPLCSTIRSRVVLTWLKFTALYRLAATG